MALTIATLCCCPFDNLAGEKWERCDRRTFSNNSMAFSTAGFSSMPPTIKGSATFSATVRVGDQKERLENHANIRGNENGPSPTPTFFHIPIE